jgi:hypothetical protein
MSDVTDLQIAPWQELFVVVLLNQDNRPNLDSRERQYRAGDQLRAVAKFVTSLNELRPPECVDEKSIRHALERIWDCLKEVPEFLPPHLQADLPDWVAEYEEHGYRHFARGDVLVVGETAYTSEGFAWPQVTINPDQVIT